MDKILIIRLSSPIVCFQNRLCLVRLFRNEDRSRRKIQRLPAFELQCADTVNAGLQKQDRIILRIRGSSCIICAENCQRVQVAAVRLNEKVVRFRRGKVQFLTAKRSGQMQRLWQDFCAAQRRNGLRGQPRCVERNHDEAMRSAVRDRACHRPEAPLRPRRSANRRNAPARRAMRCAAPRHASGNHGDFPHKKWNLHPMLERFSCASPLHRAGGHAGHDLLLRAEIQQHDRE